MVQQATSVAKHRVLVVGGAGYIGSHAAKLLTSRGHDVIVLDNLSTGHRKALETVDCAFFEGEAKDHDLVEKIVKKHGIDTVMHFAAKALVGESIENPLLYYRANVTETTELLESLLKNNVGKFVFSSTCATFGVPERNPIVETEKQDPVNPYGQSKLVIEMMLRDLCRFKGFQAVVLRYFNAAGADPSGAIGEVHTPETHLIPLALQAALSGKPLTVFGNDYETRDGTCVRDYVHVNDLALAHILAMDWMFKPSSRGFEHFNLGSEQGYSVLEILKTIEKVTGKKVPYTLGERRPGDPPTLVGDSSKAKKVLGWNRAFSLEDIISSAMKFLVSHRNGF